MKKTSAYARKRKGLPTYLPINMRFGKETETKLQLIPHDSLANFKAGHQTEPDCCSCQNLRICRFLHNTSNSFRSVSPTRCVYISFNRSLCCDFSIGIRRRSSICIKC